MHKRLGLTLFGSLALIVAACGGGGETGRAEHAKADDVHGKVKKDHTGHTDEQTAREISSRITHLACNEARRLPSPVCEKNGNQRGAERLKKVERWGTVHERTRIAFNRGPSPDESTHDQAKNGHHFD